MSTITAEELLDLSGESAFDCITDLNLRGRGLETFQPWCSKLPNLTLLALSHNAISSLRGFSSLRQLRHVNLNANALVNLDELQFCTRLIELHACNNCIRDLGPCAALTALTALGLFSNSVGDLNGALGTLAQLPRLQRLDLAGNPCADAPEYQHQILSLCTNLVELDGDPTATADRTDHETCSPAPLGATAAAALQPAQATKPTPRPGTAPARSAACKLFSTQFLNTSPLLLQYLAASYTEQHLPQTEEQLSRRRSFVHKLRHTAARMAECSGLDAKDLAQDPSLLQLGVAGSGLPASLDLGDPYELMKDLLSLCEKLQLENAQLREAVEAAVRGETGSGMARGCVGRFSSSISSISWRGAQGNSTMGLGVGQMAAPAEAAAVMGELKQLQQENRNMEWIRQENKALRAELELLRQQPHPDL